MNPLERIEQQKKALEQISQYMELFNNIVHAGVSACKVVEANFHADHNNELIILADKCYQIARENDLNFEINLRDYSYRGAPFVEPQKYEPFGLPTDMLNEQFSEQNSGLEYTSEEDAEWARIEIERTEDPYWHASNC